MNANRERFERELHRLRGFWFARLLVVGARADVERGNYRSDLSPVAVLSTLAAFEVRYGVPVVWVNDPEAAARQVESWVWWCARELVVQANEVRRGSKRL
jgi:ERCC4-type nuclease